MRRWFRFIFVLIPLFILPLSCDDSPTSPETYTLTLSVNQAGWGTTNPPTGLYNYDEDYVVTITAEPIQGYQFVGWEGDVADPTSPTTTVTITGDMTVVANFEKMTYTIYEDVTTQEAYSLISDNKGKDNFIILDVRTPQEYSSGHLENAINIDYNSPTFQDSLATLAREKTYLLYCRTGGRSSRAFEMMKELDFKEVYHMVDGIVGWLEDELPTVQ